MPVGIQFFLLCQISRSMMTPSSGVHSMHTSPFLQTTTMRWIFTSKRTRKSIRMCIKCIEKLFLNPGKKAGSASQRYCCQLSKLVTQHAQRARHYLRLSHFNAHGIRKGSGLYASSATTNPPSFVAVAARGKILDVYFKFAMDGDQYLGRMLAFFGSKR